MGTSFDRRIGALPAESTSFIGREAELAEGRLLLGRSRLVTLTGTGGVGKTRLAGRLAGSVARVFQGSVWFVELDQVFAGAEMAEIADVVAGTLQIPASAQRSVDALVDHIAANTVLLVFDNCEHVLVAAAELIRVILRKCPDVTVLATSREPLGLTGESVLPVPALQVSMSGEVSRSHDAVSLFVERAQAAAPGYNPDTAELHTIAEVCAYLEGLPLAIELAAVRIRVTGPTQILGRLQQRPLDFLNRKNRDLPERQRTLRSSIEWSYELCNPQERWLWTRLSVFAGIWDLDAAEAIADPAVLARETVIDVLQSLIEKSLVVGHHEAGEHWYGMLNSIREFGQDVLTESNELIGARALHCAWYLRRLHEAEAAWIGPDQARWLTFFLRELPNLRAALEFSLSDSGDPAAALELTTVAWRISWQAVGRIDEHRRWLARALRSSTERTSARAQALTLDAMLVNAQGGHELASTEIAEARTIADELDDLLLDAIVSSGQAELLPDSARSLELRKKAAAVQNEHPYLAARLNAPTRLAMMYERNGDIENAARWRDAFLTISETTGERYESSYLLAHAGAIAMQRGDIDTGRGLLRQSLWLKQGLTNTPAIGQAHEQLAHAAVLERDFELAATLLGAAQTAWRIAGGLPYTVTDLLHVREETEQAARDVMGERDFTRAFDRGRALSVDEGIAVALGNTKLPEPFQASDATGDSTTAHTILTKRERQVADLVANGLSDKQIAAQLLISRRTAEGHVRNALVKLGFTSRTQLGVWSTQLESPPTR